ncbi:hypothetical protein BLD44_029815 [Mastigocladus laminosus UU774]|nr:hypothetical protein BLD44_029815 [Mastigocladus laminosus UU774]
MPTGVSPLYYPEQPKPPFNLELDDSYFLIKLHDTQAFFQTGWLNKPAFLTLSSSVESSFKPNFHTQSLHKISTIQKNVPCRLGIGTNLTNWLPARAGDSLLINIKYTVLQDKPIRNLIAQMEQIDLVAKLSLRPDWAVALKVSNVVGKLLSYLVQEGSQHEIFPLTMDLNVADLKTGYYVVIGSHNDELWISPKFMQIDHSGCLLDKSEGASLSCLSYAVIKVLGMPRLKQQMFSDEPWFELLQTVKENILDTPYNVNDKEERRRLLAEWYFTLKQVRGIARKQQGFLQSEIQEIIAAAQMEVDKKLQPQTIAEASGLNEELPEDLQDILGVATEKELQGLARDYQTTLELSQQLLEEYNLLGD